LRATTPTTSARQASGSTTSTIAASYFDIPAPACEVCQDADRHHHHHPETPMNLHLTIGPLLSLIAGIMILVVPRLLSYIVAIYLIAMGLIGLFGTGLLR
jgi:hypothetical protein